MNFERFLSRVLSDERITDLRQRAYLLATVRHESDRRWYTKNPADIWLPCDEIGKGKGHKYEIPVNGKVYYGRGFVQLTWAKNYITFSKLLGVDLVGNPELANDYDIAYKILSIGSADGLFTGKKLADYINDKTCDYVNARRVINGTDRAEPIAGRARKFEVLLRTIRSAA
jgi:putative chitinase